MTAAQVPPGEHDVLPPSATYALRLGDDALIASHRLAECITHAPQLEEDVALANISLDLLGQARTLLSYAGALEGTGRDEDALAYRRTERDFVNCQLVERPNTDFAHTVVRQLMFAAYQYELYRRLAGTTEETLAALAAKAVKEVAYHRDHATQWALRLGAGTDESHQRMATATYALWPYADELFSSDRTERDLAAAGVAVDTGELREPWRTYVGDVLEQATLAVPEVPAAIGPGGSRGRQGVHTECFGYLLAEMQHVHRAHPGAAW